MICGALDAADNALNCDAPQPSNPILCSAINAAQSALQCDSVGPGQGCSVTGCGTGYYCDTVQDICLITKPTGTSCNINEECQSGGCEDFACL